ncbi:MAG: hypothetical protein Q4C49_02180 [Bacillota bacterium]|nr:hypothetical protein [Bacillota bacterium]
MNKILKVLSAASMAAILAACSSSNAPAQSSDKLTGTYSASITGEDWGCGVDKVTVKLSSTVDSVTVDDVKVTEVKEATDWAAEGGPKVVKDLTTERTVTDAYLVDANGEKTTKASDTMVIEMTIDPNTGSPIWYSMESGYNQWSDPYTLNIEFKDAEIDATPTAMTSPADAWNMTTMTAGDFTYNVAEYKVDKAETLFVWLHGMGEGGAGTGINTDAGVTILANKVTALAGEDFQETLGGVSVIAPQSPTMWMEGDKGEIAGPRHSKYEQSLIELIDNYVKENNIKNVFIGGCSNGGYMTMNIALECGDKYTGYVPICEAMLDEYITDEDIATLAKSNMYFVWAKNDETVLPEKYEEPTVARIQAANPVNLSISVTDDVHDTTGKYDHLNEGKPYQYNGHWSWIYFDNDETADQNGVSAFDWMAAIIK